MKIIVLQFNYFHFIAKSRNSGVTLIEMLAVVVIIGIIAAIASPSLIGLLRQNQVKSALIEIDGAIKEAQKQAIRQGRLCRINLNPLNNKLTGNPAICLLRDRNINSTVIIRTNLSGTPPNISFSHKGSTTKSGTIVVSSDLTQTQKCFVISLGLGITRTGNYTGSPTGSVSATNCQTQ